jgi:hypothetical protein
MLLPTPGLGIVKGPTVGEVAEQVEGFEVMYTQFVGGVTSVTVYPSPGRPDGALIFVLLFGVPVAVLRVNEVTPAGVVAPTTVKLKS